MRVCVLRICIHFLPNLSRLPSLYFLSSLNPKFHPLTSPSYPRCDPRVATRCRGEGICLNTAPLPSSSSSLSLATFSRSFSPPAASAVIDMPPAINQHSSRAEQRPLSERTGLATLEKRVREEELIQLSSQESPTTHHFTGRSIFHTHSHNIHNIPPEPSSSQHSLFC